MAVEVNASDTRNKSDKSALKGVAGKLSNSIREMATNASLNMSAERANAGRDKVPWPQCMQVAAPILQMLTMHAGKEGVVGSRCAAACVQAGWCATATMAFGHVSAH